MTTTSPTMHQPIHHAACLSTPTPISPKQYNMTQNYTILLLHDIKLFLHCNITTKSLFKLYNSDYNLLEFSLLNFNQVFTSRQMTFKTLKSNRTKIGLNSLANRLHHINYRVPFEWLNNSFETFKVKCKKLFLQEKL